MTPQNAAKKIYEKLESKEFEIYFQKTYYSHEIIKVITLQHLFFD